MFVFKALFAISKAGIPFPYLSLLSPSYEACEQLPAAQIHRTDRLMDMPPCGQP